MFCFVPTYGVHQRVLKVNSSISGILLDPFWSKVPKYIRRAQMYLDSAKSFEESSTELHLCQLPSVLTGPGFFMIPHTIFYHLLVWKKNLWMNRSNRILICNNTPTCPITGRKLFLTLLSFLLFYFPSHSTQGREWFHWSFSNGPINHQQWPTLLKERSHHSCNSWKSRWMTKALWGMVEGSLLQCFAWGALGHRVTALTSCLSSKMC